MRDFVPPQSPWNPDSSQPSPCVDREMRTAQSNSCGKARGPGGFGSDSCGKARSPRGFGGFAPGTPRPDLMQQMCVFWFSRHFLSSDSASYRGRRTEVGFVASRSSESMQGDRHTTSSSDSCDVHSGVWARLSWGR